MGSRSTLIVVVFGVIGLALLGLLVKFAFDANPALAKVTKAKLAVAEDLAGRGIDGLAVRSLGKRQGYSLRVGLTSKAEEAGGLDALAAELARRFVSHFEGTLPPQLQVTLFRRQGFACRSEVELSHHDFSVPELRRDLAIESAIAGLRGLSEPASGLRVLRVERVEVDALRVELAPAKDAAPAEAPAETPEQALERLEAHWSALEAWVWARLGKCPVRQTTLVVRSSASAGEVLKEATSERSRVPWRR